MKIINLTAPVSDKTFGEKRKGEVFCGLVLAGTFDKLKTERNLQSARLGVLVHKVFNPLTQKHEDHFAVFTTKDEYQEKMRYFYSTPGSVVKEPLTVGTWKA